MTRLFARRVALLLAVSVAAVRPSGAQAPRADLSSAVNLFEHHRYNEAKTQLAAIVAADPKNADAMLYLGRISLIDRNAGEAIGWLERGTAADSKSSALHYWLGVAYGQQASRAGKFKQAMSAKRAKNEFEKAVELDPTNINARMGLVQFYVVAPGLFGGSTDKAQQQIAEIRRLSPFRGYLATAYVAERKERFADAEREYLAATATFPDSLIAAYQLAQMFHRTKAYDKAFTMLDGLLAKHPNDAGLHYYYGRTAALSGENLERGEKALRFYLTQPEGEGRSPHASAHVRLGQIHERRGEKDLAKKEFQRALEQDPDQPEAKDGLKRVK